jgi:hypothetical protein
VISDAVGKTVRTLEIGKDAVAGVNRVWWDLRLDPTDEIKLRTPPLHAPEFKLNADGTRKFPVGSTLSMLAAPGTYTVKLVAGDVERSGSLVVRKDPNTAGSEHDLAEQTKTLTSIRDNVNTVAKMINTAESVRAQLAAWRAVVAASPAAKDLQSEADAVEKAVVDIESRQFNLTATGRGQDFLRTPSQMLDKLMHLADVVSYADFAPTDSQIEVAVKLTQDVAHDREQMDGVLARTLAGFNAKLAARQMGAIVAPKD